MVNIAKRWRSFKPLLRVQYGPGAVTLPPSPAPQLTQVHLRFPLGTWGDSVKGARRIWRDHLQSLKYHYPALPIIVQHEPGTLASPITLTLQFEGSDQEALKALAQKSSNFGQPKTKTQPLKVNQEEEERKREQEASTQSPNWRQAPSKQPQPVTTSSPSSPSSTPSSATSSTQPSQRPSADDDEIKLKPLPPADPSSPSTTSPPTPIYTRSVTLGIKDRTADDIWFWFQKRTNCKKVWPSNAVQKQTQELKKLADQSEQDRQRVKAGMDAMRREKEELKKAREAAERLSADA